MKRFTVKRTAALLAIAAAASCASFEKSEGETLAEAPPSATSDSVSGGEAAESAARPEREKQAVAAVGDMREEARPMEPSPEPMARPAEKPMKAEAKRKSKDDADRDGRAQLSMDAPMSPPTPPPMNQVVDPQGSEDYKNYGVNKMTKSSEDKFSTFSIDVDTGAYTIARKKLNDGYVPPAASVRVEEFVNYFAYSYPNPDGGAFGVHLEAAPSPFSGDADKYLLRVGVQGKRVSPAERKSVHLTFLVDVSGSMGAPDKLPLAKKSLQLLTNNLREGDTVALATYAGHTAKVLEPTGMKDRKTILRAIESLGSGGGTGMSNGMEVAYKMALSNHKRGDVNRVIVLSDGDANIGPMSHDQILASIKNYVEEGVTLSTIGLGMGNYKDTMMEQLANKGNGNYYYIDDFKEAKKVFESQMDGTLQVIAKDVKIQVEFDPKAISEYRLIGYENRDIADEDFRDDTVDAGEIGAGHTVTALYEVKLNRKATGKLATVRIRAKQPDGFAAAEQEFQFRDGDVRKRVSDASTDFQFASAVAMFAEVLRESPYSKAISLDLIEEVAKAATSRKQEDRREFLELVRKAKRLRRG